MHRSEQPPNSLPMPTGNRESTRSLRGIDYFVLLNRLVDEYTKPFQSDGELNASSQNCFLKKDERLARIQKINSFIEQIELYCNLTEEEKNDCLGESLQIVKKIRQNPNRNDIETRSKRLSLTSELKAIYQVEMAVVQNMAELILLKMVPANRTLHTICQFIRTLIEQLYECQPQYGIEPDRQKTKKPNRKNQKDRMALECSLQSGARIDLVWYLIFRVVQKNLQEIFQLFHAEKQKDGDIQLAQIYDKYVNKFIREVINRLILDQFAEANLSKELLKAIVHNLSEIQLPIVPFFLKCLHQILEEHFKIYYTISFDRDHSQKIASKELYSLENIQALLEIIDKSTNNMAEYQSSKIQTKLNGVCSYCGVSKINSWDRLIYQKIAVKINEKHNLVISICEQCCLSLNTEPSEQMSIMIFAPLIMSRFWKEEMSNHRLGKVREGLRGLLMYHGMNQAKNAPKSKRNKSDQMTITEKVAMNNSEQTVPVHLLTQIYNSFLFRHAKLSTKQIVVNLLQITNIFWNSPDQKVRERSIKMVNKPYIISFLFDSVNQPEKADVVELSHKIVKCLQARLRDSSDLVGFASLQFLADLFSRRGIRINQRQRFFDTICKTIQQQKNTQCRFKMYEILQRMLNKLRALQGDLEAETIIMKCYLRTYQLIMRSCCSSDEENHSEGSNEGDQISRLTQTVFSYLSSVAELESRELKQALWEILDPFFRENCHRMLELRCLQQVTDQLLLDLVIRIKLMPTLLKSLAFLRVQTVRSMVGLLESSQCLPDSQQTIQHNICLLIEAVFQDVLNLNQQICTRKRRQSGSLKSCKLNIQQIGDYINSSSFVDLLVNCISEADKDIDPKDVKLPGRSKLYILDKLLKCNSVNNIISQRREVIKYMNIWSKNNRKSVAKTIDPIILSSNLELRLQILAQGLLQALKSSDLDVLELQASLVINIKIILGSVQDLKHRVLLIYQKYSHLFFEKYLSLHSQLKNSSKNVFNETYLMTYLSLNRCLHISTVLVVKLQAFLLQNVKVEQFYEKEIACLVDGKKQSKFSSYNKDQDNEFVTTSQRFRKLYTLIISVLAHSDDFIKKDSQMLQSYKKMLLLLRYYWQVHPKSIFIDSRLTAILKEVDEKTQDGFFIVRSMFKLFQSVLPCQNIQLLSFVREQFAKRIHFLIRETGKQDREFIQSSFSIIYHLLKSGMEGVYQYNKYVFYGLLSPYSQVNQLTLKLVKEIYSGQTSEKVLFINLMESLEFCLSSFYQQKTFQEVQLTETQRERLQLLSELTRKKSSCLLVKDKRQIKMKSTFVKKVGDVLVSEMTMIKSKPALLILFLKVIKCQRVLDYIQVSEIAFSLNKLMLHHQLFIQEQIQGLKLAEVNSETKENIRLKKLQIVAYRQLVSCLAYFSKYQEVTHQIKTYESAFEQSKTPYLELQESVPLTRIDQADSLKHQVQIMEKEINIFINIILGDIQCVARAHNDWQHQDQNSGSSNQTVLTRAKGSKKGKNHEPKQNKRRKHSASLDKFTSDATSLEASSSEVDSYKTRLRRQEKRNYKLIWAEC